jgi:glucose-6-phosphate 1-epimerase
MSYVHEGIEHLAARGDCVYDGSKGLSGGIPHCFPMFGSADGTTVWTGAQHGFARNTQWRIVSRSAASVTLQLSLDDVAEADRSGWTFPFAVDYTVALSASGAELTCLMAVHNTGTESFDFTAALHTYLACSHCDAVSVRGNFLGSTFVDKLDGRAKKTEERSAITLDGTAYDRIYVGVTGDIRLEDTAPGRPGLTLGHGGHVGWQDCVVWNPYGDEQKRYRDFICIEACVSQQPVVLGPGEGWQSSYSVRPDTDTDTDTPVC